MDNPTLFPGNEPPDRIRDGLKWLGGYEGVDLNKVTDHDINLIWRNLYDHQRRDIRSWWGWF